MLEKTIRGERAFADEKTRGQERVILLEETGSEKRASDGEKANPAERAIGVENTVIPERAIRDEETKENEHKEDQVEKLTDEELVAQAIPERQLKDLPFWTDTALSVEKLRVACQVRATHLKLQGRENEETDKLISLLVNVEGYVDGQLARWILGSPAYPWFSRVKGIGKENIGKVIGLVDIERAPTISSLWKFAGYAVEDGKAPKRKKGEKNPYNARLRTMCWRVGSSLMRAGGKFYDYYISEKAKYEERFAGDSTMTKGHLHNMALRKMIKLFLSCLWLTWREGAGLPTRPPYPMEYLGHTTYIDPWTMVDR